MDHFLVGIFIRRKVRFMAKSQLFKPPAVESTRDGGVFPVRRGARDEEAFVTAEAILARGGVVAMYPEGGRSRTGDLAERARPGIGRLALDTRRAGRADRDPRLLARSATGSGCASRASASSSASRSASSPSPDASRERQQEVADEIFARIRALYDGLEEHGRDVIRRRVREQARP